MKPPIGRPRDPRIDAAVLRKTAALVRKLGYADVKPRQIPSELFTLMPVGPSLDPVQARRTDPQ